MNTSLAKWLALVVLVVGLGVLVTSCATTGTAQWGGVVEKGSAKGGASLTALPIVETEAQNISAYIPTNLISITDGQLYLSPSLFQMGNLPAVDVGKSVSRVGGKAQLPAFRAVAGDLKLAYSQFEELELFSRFGTRLDDTTRKTLARGRRIRECLRQSESDPFSVPEQITVLLALASGLFDDIPLDQMKQAEQTLREAALLMPASVREHLLRGCPFPQDEQNAIRSFAEGALRPYRKENHDRDARQPETQNS